MIQWCEERVVLGEAQDTAAQDTAAQACRTSTVTVALTFLAAGVGIGLAVAQVVLIATGGRRA